MTKLFTPMFLVIPVLLAATTVHAFDRSELVCMRQIGETGRGHFEAVLAARIGCENRAIRGRIEPSTDCGAGAGDNKLQRKLDRAATVLGREMHDACDEVDLGALGFPGQCGNDKGVSFDVNDLEDCIDDFTDETAARLMDFYYPTIDHPHRGYEEICLRGSAGQASRMLRGDGRARENCILGVADGALSGELDCREDIPAWGDGTGDQTTDDHIQRAYLELLAGVPDECKHFDLDALGYQDRCEDFTGGSFNAIDLKSCLFDENRVQVQELLDLLFPFSND